jgi:hypothetical protein
VILSALDLYGRTPSALMVLRENGFEAVVSPCAAGYYGHRDSDGGQMGGRQRQISQW